APWRRRTGSPRRAGPPAGRAPAGAPRAAPPPVRPRSLASRPPAGPSPPSSHAAKRCRIPVNSDSAAQLNPAIGSYSLLSPSPPAQPRARLVLAHRQQLARHAADAAHLADVKQAVHHGADKVLDPPRLAGRLAAVARRLADHLAHLQPAARQQQRRQFAPVV